MAATRLGCQAVPKSARQRGHGRSLSGALARFENPRTARILDATGTRHDGGVTTIAGASAASDEPAVADALLAFARGLRGRHVRGAVLAALLRSLLAVAAPCIVIGWLVPAWRVHVLVALAAISLTAGLLATLRARRLAAQVLLTVTADGDDGVPGTRENLRELQDELATWLEHRRADATPMRQWLARDTKTFALPSWLRGEHLGGDQQELRVRPRFRAVSR